jgi:DNA-binding NtrC family response regulator
MGNQDNPRGPMFARPTDVLIVEDNYIIALDTEGMLQEMGIETVRTANSITQALAMIAERVPGYAFVDVNLGDEKSFAVAEKLHELGVPFAFATGYGSSDDFPPHFVTMPIVAKPYSLARLRFALFNQEE